MTMVAIDRYALAHGLPVAALLSAVIEGSEVDDITRTTEIPVTELDAIRDLTYEVAVDDLTEAREILEDTRADLRSAEKNLQACVREALKEGVPATVVAKTVGVSRARVYQLRDGKR